MAIVESLVAGNITLDIDQTVSSETLSLLESVLQKLTESPAAASEFSGVSRTIIVQQVDGAGSSFTNLTARMNLDPASWTDRRYFDFQGNLQNMSFAEVFSHELIHATLGKGDPNSNWPRVASDPFGYQLAYANYLNDSATNSYGDTVAFNNKIVVESSFGLKARSNYFELFSASDSSDPTLSAEIKAVRALTSFTFGNSIDNCFQAFKGQDLPLTFNRDGSVKADGSDSRDLLIGYGGDEFFKAGAGNDYIYGGGGIDDIRAGDGDDFLDGGSGGDKLNGGEGHDIVGYRTSVAGVTIDLRLERQVGGDAEGDTYVSIEGVRGSSHDDILKGDANFNILIGGDGDDTLQTQKRGANVTKDGFYQLDENGYSILTGGIDSLDGGSGYDTYQINSNVAPWARLTGPGSAVLDQLNMPTNTIISDSDGSGIIEWNGPGLDWIARSRIAVDAGRSANEIGRNSGLRNISSLGKYRIANDRLGRRMTKRQCVQSATPAQNVAKLRRNRFQSCNLRAIGRSAERGASMFC